MSLFKKKNNNQQLPLANTNIINSSTNTQNPSSMADLALSLIADGILLVGADNRIEFANPAAAAMTGYDTPQNIIGLDYQFVMTLEDSNSQVVPPETSKLSAAVRLNEAFSTREYTLVAAQTEKRVAISLSVTPTGDANAARIITFRDITNELEEEGKQSEFISTASHEMRTPVASIEGYLGLALNPQTATIDERARQYLEAAHSASQHLGHLFKDLLDVTKLDDGRSKIHLVPIDVVEKVRGIAAERENDMRAKRLRYNFGTSAGSHDARKIEPKAYAAVDVEFLREILDNLIGNAIKYTPEGGEIWVNATADGDKVIISVTDTGIGIAADDIGHVFQKFYRVDNSQTRSIGGTGLGLYLVKQQTEAMSGRVWVESSFGKGSTFFVSLPRLSNTEYEKWRIAYENEQAAEAFSAQQAEQNQAGVAWPGTGTNSINNAGGINSGAITSSNVPTQTAAIPIATASVPQNSGGAAVSSSVAPSPAANPSPAAAPTSSPATEANSVANPSAVAGTSPSANPNPAVNPGTATSPAVASPAPTTAPVSAANQASAATSSVNAQPAYDIPRGTLAVMLAQNAPAMIVTDDNGEVQPFLSANMSAQAPQNPPNSSNNPSLSTSNNNPNEESK